MASPAKLISQLDASEREKGCRVDSRCGFSLKTPACLTGCQRDKPAHWVPEGVRANDCLPLWPRNKLATSLTQCVKIPHLDAARSSGYKSKWPRLNWLLQMYQIRALTLEMTKQARLCFSLKCHGHESLSHRNYKLPQHNFLAHVAVRSWQRLSELAINTPENKRAIDCLRVGVLPSVKTTWMPPLSILSIH